MQFFFLGFIKNHQAGKAIELFKEIKNPDEVGLTLLFHACAQLGTADALHLVNTVSKQMPESFHSNDHLANSLCDALIKCGDCTSAELLHLKMTKTVENYGNLMAGFNKANEPLKTLNLFNQMKTDGIEANSIIYLCVIKALSQLGHFELAHSIIKDVPKSFLLDIYIQTSLIDLWVRRKEF